MQFFKKNFYVVTKYKVHIYRKMSYRVLLQNRQIFKMQKFVSKAFGRMFITFSICNGSIYLDDIWYRDSLYFHE